MIVAAASQMESVGPSWPFVVAAVWLLFLTVEYVMYRRAAPDPDPSYTQLDCWDGLDSRID